MLYYYWARSITSLTHVSAPKFYDSKLQSGFEASRHLRHLRDQRHYGIMAL